MPLDPDKVRHAVEMADNLTKRMDALLARRAKRDEDKAKKKADRDFETRREADQSQSPDWLDIAPYEAPAWFDDSHLSSEREELRTGSLSKERI
jgi:hypothetical protein